MIKLEQDINDFFFCTSADWSTVVKAGNENEAASKAVSKVMDELKEGALISPCLSRKRCAARKAGGAGLAKNDVRK